MDIALLKKVVSNYNAFCTIAENLKWIEIKEIHKDWFKTYPLGIFIDAYAFPEGYIQNNIASVYVRTVLSGMAFSEGWNKDFWNISQEERKKCLTAGEFLYKPYAIVKEVRFIERDWEYLVQEIKHFATQNKILAVEQKRYINQFENAKVIEIGGSYSGDFIYMAIKQNFVLIVSCGFWD